MTVVAVFVDVNTTKAPLYEYGTYQLRLKRIRISDGLRTHISKVIVLIKPLVKLFPDSSIQRKFKGRMFSIELKIAGTPPTSIIYHFTIKMPIIYDTVLNITEHPATELRAG